MARLPTKSETDASGQHNAREVGKSKHLAAPYGPPTEDYEKRWGHAVEDADLYASLAAMAVRSEGPKTGIAVAGGIDGTQAMPDMTAAEIAQRFKDYAGPLPGDAVLNEATSNYFRDLGTYGNGIFEPHFIHPDAEHTGYKDVAYAWDTSDCCGGGTNAGHAPWCKGKRAIQACPSRAYSNHGRRVVVMALIVAVIVVVIGVYKFFMQGS